MLLLLPVGHEDLSVRRLPWVSIGIVAICLGLQIYSSTWTGPSYDEGAFFELTRQLLTECQIDETCVAEWDDPVTSVQRAIDVNQVGSPGAQQEWRKLHAAFDAATSAHPVHRYGFKPARFHWSNLLTSMFMHGGFLHLISNMFILYLVGVSLEDRWGRAQFLGFYLAGGVVATLTYASLHRGSDIPLVGASGAIAAAMGAFMVLFARSRIKFVWFAWLFLLVRYGSFSLPAVAALFLWFLQQAFYVAFEMSGQGGVAYSAHAGGFLFGAVVALGARALGWDDALVRASEVKSGGWVEDPRIERARSLIEQGDSRAAMSLLHPLATTSQDLPGASGARGPSLMDIETSRELVFGLALDMGNWRLVQRQAVAIGPRLVDDDPGRLIDAFHQIKPLVDGPMDPRFLGIVAEAAHRASDPNVATEVVQRLYRAAPNATELPRALLALAKIAREDGDERTASAVFERLERQFPNSPAATEARQLAVPDPWHAASKPL